MKSNINDTLNVLHLSNREDREINLLKQFSEQNINSFLIWEGEEYPHNRKMGVCRGHKRVIEFAKKMQLPRVHFCEDDISFFAPLAWQYYLDNVPDDYDMYFGMIYHGVIKDNRIASVCSGFTLYTVHERFYDTFLSVEDDAHIDREITQRFHESHKLMVCDKFVCEQFYCKSDNTRMICDYTPYLEGRPIYKNEI